MSWPRDLTSLFPAPTALRMLPLVNNLTSGVFLPGELILACCLASVNTYEFTRQLEVRYGVAVGGDAIEAVRAALRELRGQ